MIILDFAQSIPLKKSARHGSASGAYVRAERCTYMLLTTLWALDAEANLGFAYRRSLSTSGTKNLGQGRGFAGSTGATLARR
jgi:hypothetical protein